MTITLNLKPQWNALLRGFDNEFYGLLSRAKQWGNMYIRLLDDIRENYKQARIYAEYEINN